MKASAVRKARFAELLLSKAQKARWQAVGKRLNTSDIVTSHENSLRLYYQMDNLSRYLF